MGFALALQRAALPAGPTVSANVLLMVNLLIHSLRLFSRCKLLSRFLSRIPRLFVFGCSIAEGVFFYGTITQKAEAVSDRRHLEK